MVFERQWAVIMGKHNKLAFGLTPSNRRYRLRYARYMGLVDAVNEYISISLHESGGMLDLLDVGPGSGRTMQYLDHYGSADMISFYGIDINKRRLSTIYGKERWKLIQADVTEGLPYPPNRFDIVVCEQVLEHLRNPEFVIRQMEQVLRPGGLLVVGVPTRPPGIAAIVRFLKSSGVGGGHIQVFTLFSLAQLIGKSGELDVFHVRGFRFTSGGPLGLLENTRWFWRLNSFLGRLFPYFCGEVQFLCRKVALSTGQRQGYKRKKGDR